MPAIPNSTDNAFWHQKCLAHGLSRPQFRRFRSVSIYMPKTKSQGETSNCRKLPASGKPPKGREKASREQPQPEGKARAVQKVQGNDLSRLCKHDPCESVTILHILTSIPQQAPAFDCVQDPGEQGKAPCSPLSPHCRIIHFGVGGVGGFADPLKNSISLPFSLCRKSNAVGSGDR